MTMRGLDVPIGRPGKAKPQRRDVEELALCPVMRGVEIRPRVGAPWNEAVEPDRHTDDAGGDEDRHQRRDPIGATGHEKILEGLASRARRLRRRTRALRAQELGGGLRPRLAIGASLPLSKGEARSRRAPAARRSRAVLRASVGERVLLRGVAAESCKISIRAPLRRDALLQRAGHHPGNRLSRPQRRPAGHRERAGHRRRRVEGRDA